MNSNAKGTLPSPPSAPRAAGQRGKPSGKPAQAALCSRALSEKGMK